MRKHPLKIEWRSTPKPDGVERLGRAVALVLKQAMEATARSNANVENARVVDARRPVVKR